MKRYLTDRGIQAAITGGLVIATMAMIADRFRTAYLVIGGLERAIEGRANT